MKEDKNRGEYKYLTYCMPAGLVAGTVIAVAASLNIGTGAGMGMLLGVVAGTTADYVVKNKKQEK